ncbi:hypothetical protein [Flavobacterium sp.]|uniref:hypothetical protein n=1 Tax=Flavobacterium sp. TaxID=239 RepID=UPI003D0C9DCF
MKKSLIILFSILYSININAKIPVAADRWLEIDLYWFEHKDMQKSANEFWERYEPLMKGIDGWRGVIINVGWITDYLYEWQGDLNQEIKLPKNMKTWGSIKDGGQLAGTTTERMDLWKERFEKADQPQSINYEKWTYVDLKKLVAIIKKTAQNKYHLKDIKVGTFITGGQNSYDGDKSSFSLRHVNSYKNGKPNMIAKLAAESHKYGAFPRGIAEGTPLTEFFGKQWGSLSKALNLDVIILRDGFLGTGLYSRRKGPYGETAPKDPQLVAEWSKATADLVKQTKLANPKALVIGYSNAASAIGGWRANCFDLETIAKEGFLDGWIDQSWAGSWNEVGQRPVMNYVPEVRFWSSPLLGYSYMLGYMLTHSAMLADTKVHHYFLTETFDAWETWDMIHNARERLRWGIWAYSHAALKTPSGLKMPQGSYISWCNRGKMLLPEEDVKFLAQTTNDAFADAAETKEVFGPTIVYNRSAMEWQSANKPDETIKEWIDEQAGTLMKWSAPIMSATRLEYLPKIESDLFVFQAPSHLNASEKENVITYLKSGKPAMVIGSPSGGLDKEIADILGVSSTNTAINGTKYIGTINYKTDGIYASLPNTFPIFQPFTQNKFSNELESIYSVSSSPALGYNTTNGKNLIYWDAPEFFNNLPGGTDNYKGSLDQIMGSPVSYVLTARLMNEVMKKSGFVYVDEIKQDQPLQLSMWQLKDGSFKIMAGNLEEGINHTANHTVGTILNLPALFVKNQSVEVAELWNKNKTIIGNKKLEINLTQAQTKLYKIEKP